MDILKRLGLRPHDTEPTKTRGGEQMGNESSEREGMMELDQDELERLIDERADERAEVRVRELQASQEEEREAHDRSIHLELSRLRRRDHEATVKEQVQAHQERGVPVVVLTRAAELMLADTSHEAVLELSQDGEDVSLTATDIVLHLLDSIPAASLHASQPVIARNNGTPPEGEDTRTAKEKAEELIDDLKSGEIIRVPSA